MRSKINPLSDNLLLGVAKDLVVRQGVLSSTRAETLIGENIESCQKIASDGSTRRFWRVTSQDRGLCIIAAPATRSLLEINEASAAWQIGNHLHSKHVAVPQLYGWDEDTGLLLFEDLGDQRLHSILSGTGRGSDSFQYKNELLTEIIEKLAFMQFKGIEGFDETWCWDTKKYDLSLMIERESKYFLDAFWKGFLGGEERLAVLEELKEIAKEAEKAPADFLLHRDFQSRNIMIKDDKPFFIDFQGARRGPLGYDLASLLIDPYTQLPEDQQDSLLELYYRSACDYQFLDQELFYHHYRLLSIQRNLQIIGAFAFLYKVRGKLFFRQFLAPALLMLKKSLATKHFYQYKSLRLLVDDSFKQLNSIL